MDYETGKFIGNLLVSASVGKIVRDVINSHVVEETLRDTLQIKVGSFAIGALVSVRAWDNIETQLDKFHAVWVGASEENRKIQADRKKAYSESRGETVESTAEEVK